MATFEARAVDEGRKVKVIVIGGGISGILCGIRIPQYIPSADLVIYDKNEDIGGTWFENKYPGLACDIPAHSYQATFEPNPSWTTFYAAGSEILRYWHGVAQKYGVRKYVVSNSKVEKATWDESSSTWTVEIKNTLTNEVHTDTGDFVISATGTLNDWRWPTIKGLHDFKGKLLHTASWDKEYDYSGKKVAVIGNGSSGIQVLPAILPKVATIDHYVRGKTWIAPGFLSEEYTKDHAPSIDMQFSEELREKFRTDKDFYLQYRKNMDGKLASIHGFVYPGTMLYGLVGGGIAKHMEARLGTHPEMMARLKPAFSPGCRRLTPGPGYLEAIVDPKVNYINDPITEISSTGVVTADGTHREVDAIFCATGFNTSFTGRFPVHGRNGMSLDERWGKYPDTYLGLCTDGFPNMFFIMGPNTGPSTGSLLLIIEKQVDYIVEVLKKTQRDAILVVEPKKTSVKDFSDYCQSYFPKTIFMEDCRSWYKSEKAGGKVTALWPGSTLHLAKALQCPRWEDFDYGYQSNNQLAWLGDGWTTDERRQDGNRSWYIDPENINPPPRVD